MQCCKMSMFGAWLRLLAALCSWSQTLIVTLAGTESKYGDPKTRQMCIYLYPSIDGFTFSPPCSNDISYFQLSLEFVIILVFNANSKSSKMPPKPRLNVQNFPRPPLLERTSRHLEVKWHGQVIADTKEACWVLETYHAPSISLVLNK
jgi:hypothetical protein